MLSVFILICCLFVILFYKIDLFALVNSSFPKLSPWSKISRNVLVEWIQVTRRTFGIALFLSVIGWLLYAFCAYLFSLAIGLNFDSITIFSLIAVGVLAVFLPVSINGIGTREAFYIYYFNSLGAPPEKAIIFSMLFLLVTVILAICGGLILLRSKGTSYPIKLHKAIRKKNIRGPFSL